MGGQMFKLMALSLQRVLELGQDAFAAHEYCMRYGEGYDITEITERSVECKAALESQRKWIDAIKESIID